MSDHQSPALDRATLLAVFDACQAAWEHPGGGADVHITPDMWRRLKRAAEQREVRP